jgi:type I restriction enzyme, S subunit
MATKDRAATLANAGVVTLLPARVFPIPSRWLRGGDSRFDAASYSEAGFDAFGLLQRTHAPLEAFGTLVARIYHPTESQARSNFKRIWVERERGVPFLTGKQLFFFRPDRAAFVSPSMPKMDELRVGAGTILLSRSGTTGVPVIAGRWLAQFAITDDAIRIFPSATPPGYLYAYLATSIGQTLLARNEYGGMVGHLEAKHVAGMPTPRLGPEFEAEIDSAIAGAYQLRDDANILLDAADAALHEALGLAPFSDADVEYLGSRAEPRAFATASVDLGDRIDAAHHVPLTKSVVARLRGARFPVVPLASVVGRVYVAPRFARVYVESSHGTPLLQGHHLPQLRPLDLKYISNSHTDRMDRWIIHEGSVLVTCSGTVGRVALTTRALDGWAASQHILRIEPREAGARPGYLAAFLMTPYGQHQLKAKIYGGVVDELTDADTGSVLFPDASRDVQDRIDAMVVAAFEMRDRANEIETDAIGRVEALLKMMAGGEAT